MSDSIVKVPKLPRSGFADGDQIADPDGNIWEYNVETKEWFLRGKFEPLPVVTEDQNGLVSPEIYRKLTLIQELIDKGVSFDVFKLKSSLDNPYFFYFQSSDGLIKFIPEAESTLRVEIDRARLYALLIKKCCIGPKGKTGPQGAKGTNGKAAANETFKAPKLENENTLVISTTVNSPIDTPISLRIFNEDKTIVAEFLAYLDGTSEFALIDGLEIEESSLELSYNKEKKLLSARITFTTYSGDLSLWRYKARQRGPTGDDGLDGKDYLEIIDTVLEDNSLESKTAVVGMRKSGTSDLRFLSADINTDICVSKISASENAPLKLEEYVSQKYLASEITTRDCKNIGFFNLAKAFDLEKIDIPNLEMPSWLPPSGCGQKTRFNNFKYNWWDYLEEDLRYMFKIVPTVKPPEKCCEQEFWYCPSSGDTCGIKGSNGEIPVLEMPQRAPEDQCLCDCDNPIELELQAGGYVFPLMNANSEEFRSGAILSQTAKSVIDGSVDRFTSNILVSGPTKIVVNVDFAPEVCGGEVTESKNCGFREISDITTIASIKDSTGNAILNSSEVLASSSFPATLEFTLTTPEYSGITGKSSIESKIELIVDANATRMNICRGYAVTIAAVKVEKTVSPTDFKPKPKEDEIKLPTSLQKIRDEFFETIKKGPQPPALPTPEIDRAPTPAQEQEIPTTPRIPITEPVIPNGNQIFRFELERDVICPEKYRRDPTRPLNDPENTMCLPISGVKYQTINGVTSVVPGSGAKQGIVQLSGRLFFNTYGLSTKRMFSPAELTSKYKIASVELVSAKNADNANKIPNIVNSSTTANLTNADIWYDDYNIWIAPNWQGEIVIRSGQARTTQATTTNSSMPFNSQGI